MPVRWSEQSSGPISRQARRSDEWDDDYSSWTLAELKEEAELRGLPKYGTKAEIAARLSE